VLEMNLHLFPSINRSIEGKGDLVKVIKAFKYTLEHEIFNMLESAVH
jgi:hypothetical protein